MQTHRLAGGVTQSRHHRAGHRGEIAGVAGRRRQLQDPRSQRVVRPHLRHQTVDGQGSQDTVRGAGAQPGRPCDIADPEPQLAPGEHVEHSDGPVHRRDPALGREQEAPLSSSVGGIGLSFNCARGAGWTGSCRAR